MTILIQHGANVRMCSAANPYPALREAVTGDYRPAVALEAKAKAEAAGTHDEWQFTALHYAAESGTTEVVSALMEHGAAKDARDDSLCRRTPLHLALIGQHVDVVRALLSAGADVSLRDGHGSGYVSLAANTGNVDVMKLLIGRGADVNAVPSISRRSALHMAAEGGHVEAIDVFVKAEADLGALDSEGQTALHHAARLSSSEALVALSRHGVDRIRLICRGRPRSTWPPEKDLLPRWWLF